MKPDRLDQLVEKTRNTTPLVGPWVRRRAAWRLWTRGTPDAIRRLATIAVESADPGLKRYVLSLLERLTDLHRIEAVAAVWARTRDVALGELIERKQWLAAEPVELRVLTALWLGLHEGMQEAPPAAVPPLLAATDDAEVRIAERAAFVLRTLAREDARQVVCDAFLDRASMAAGQAALSAGYESANPARRALFYFLTGQWRRYEALDFDGSFLRSAYEVAGADLRQRLAAVARQAGRVEYVAAAAREGRRVGEMTDVEWESAVAVLAGTRRWPELWKLAQAAPPRWSAKMLLRLAAEGWQPPGEPEGALASLVPSARAWADPDLQYDTFAAGGGSAADGRHAGPVAIAPDGQLIVTAGTDRSVSIWRPGETRALVRQVGHVPTHLAIGADGRVLAVGGAVGAVTLWGLPEGRQIARLAAHAGAVRGILPLAATQGPRLVTAGTDGRARLWSLPSGLELRAFGRSGTRLARLAVEPTTNWIAAVDEASTVSLWDPTRPSDDALWTVAADGATADGADPIDLLFADGGRTLAACVGDGVTLARCPTGKPVTHAAARVGAITTAAASPAARYLCAGGQGGSVSLVRAADGVVLRTLDGHASAVTALAASPDGHLLLSGGADGVVRLWGLPDGQVLSTLRGDAGEASDGRGAAAGAVRFAAFAPDGQRAYFRTSRDEQIRSIDLAAWRVARTPLAHMTVADLHRLQSSPTGRTAFVAALLARRFEHDVVIEDVRPERITAGEFDIELG